MFVRKLIIAAALVAPLAWSPANLSAQSRGLDRAAVATATAEQNAGWTNGNATGRPTAVPTGVANAHGDGTLPPGISRTRQTATTGTTPDDAGDAAGTDGTSGGSTGGTDADCVEGLTYDAFGLPVLTTCDGSGSPSTFGF